MKTTRLTALLIPAALLAGCNTTQNERSWLATDAGANDAVYLDMFRTPARPEAPLVDDAPSITSLTRTNWAPISMTSPMDPVAGQRTYATEFFWIKETARRRNQYPSPMSCIELNGGSVLDHTFEGWANVWVAGGDAILMPIRMCLHAPGREELSYPASYWRATDSTARKPWPAAPTETTATTTPVPPGTLPPRPETPAR